MLGIITGLGPRATVSMYGGLMTAVGRGSGGWVPRLMMYNVAVDPKVVSRFVRGPVPPEDPYRDAVRAMLGEAVIHFASNRVGTVAMGCNTLQDELSALCDEHGLAHLGMIDETARAIIAAGVERVLLLATGSTYGDDLYGRCLRGHGIDCAIPSADEQRTVEAHIHLALENGVADTDQSAFEAAVRAMARRTAAGGVILGCTDLTGDLTAAAMDMPVFDSLALLTQACAAHILSSPELIS